jgi:hypothetical protein
MSVWRCTCGTASRRSPLFRRLMYSDATRFPDIQRSTRATGRNSRMATNTWVDLRLPEAADLADYTGIEFDLRSAQEFARMLLQERKKQNPDWNLSDPLTTAILVRYARPFATGARLRLGEDALAELSPQQLQCHEYFSALRDKHIAHSVNAFEESQPTARYWVERVHEEGITEITCQHHRIIGMSIPDLGAMIDLTAVLQQYVKRKIDEERAKLLGIVRSRPIDEILSGGMAPARRDLPDPSRRRAAPGKR